MTLSTLKYDVLLTVIVMDCQYILFTLKFKANNNLCEICIVLEKETNKCNHNNYIHSAISEENITECVERQKLITLVNQVNLKITL